MTPLELGSARQLSLYERQAQVKLSLELAHPRSSKWPAFVKKLVAKEPYCHICGEGPDQTELVGHHILPYHKFPELELVEDNIFIVGETCNSGHHHLLIAHYGNFKKWNPDIRELGRIMLANRKLKEKDFIPVPLFKVLV